MKEVTNGIVKGQRTEGTLLSVPAKRLTKASRFLKSLARSQQPPKLPVGVTRIGKRSRKA